MTRAVAVTLTAVGATALMGAVHALDSKRSATQAEAAARTPPPPPPTTRPDPPFARVADAERAQRLQQTLSSLINGPVLGRLRVGMRVMDVSSGKVLFGKSEDSLMDPASNQKVLATVTALLRLGGSWQFRTELSGPAPDAEGTVAGDVVLRGNGDPSLRKVDLEEMASQLAARGVNKITGAILADARRIGADEVGTAERAPLRVIRATLDIRVRPGDHEGAPPVVTVRPPSDALVIDNRARTTRGRGKVGVIVGTAGGKIRVAISGKIALHHPGLMVRRTPPNPPLYGAILFRTALQQAGVQVRAPAGLYTPKPHEMRRTAAGARTSDAPLALEPLPRIITLASHDSDPLPILMRRINKDSDNEGAERLLETVGAEIYGGPASATKGIRALREAITELGLPPREYVPVNGSGLGHANRITAEAMADLLRRLFLDPRLGPDMLQSLSVGGVDGTTRNRFRGSPAAAHVRAKTGTLQGKSCLAGYVGDGSDILAFSIMVQGLRGRALASVRQAQVTAVNAMMRYARGSMTPAGLDDAVNAGVDFETGEEVSDIEGETEESMTDVANLEPPVVEDAPVLPRAAPAVRPAVAHPTPGRAGKDPKEESFEEVVRKAFKPPPPEESFDQKVEKAFRDFESRAPKVKPKAK